MYNRIETDRLILQLLDKTSADLVLDFLNENKEDFLQYEAAKQEMYFTKIYQEYIIENEYNAALQKKYLRYYIFRKADASRQKIIGTVSFGQIKPYPYSSAILGYKIAVDSKRQGYGTEAVRAAVREAFSYLGIHRIEAYVMEQNLPSIKLLEKCGFQWEGTCRNNLSVCGEWKTHLLYARLAEEK